MIPTAECQDCDWTGPAQLCAPLSNALQRIQPGDVMPAGECPECSAAAMLTTDDQEPCITVVTRSLPNQATHFTLRRSARDLATLMAIAHPDHNYRLQDAHPHGHRVAVYHPSPYPRMLADGYLRLLRV